MRTNKQTTKGRRKRKIIFEKLAIAPFMPKVFPYVVMLIISKTFYLLFNIQFYYFWSKPGYETKRLFQFDLNLPSIWYLSYFQYEILKSYSKYDIALAHLQKCIDFTIRTIKVNYKLNMTTQGMSGIENACEVTWNGGWTIL